METGLTPTFYALLGGASSLFKMTIFGNLILNSCWFNLILWLFSRFSKPVEVRTGLTGTLVLLEGARWHGLIV